MSEENKRVVEINGIKMEVDMRHATRVDTFKVGSKVKLLEKSSYGAANVHNGVVVGFEPFESQPTIIICYLKIDYSSCELKFAYYNDTEKSKEQWDLVASVDDDLPVEKQDVLSRMDKEIDVKRSEISEIERKRDYFLQHFNMYFEQDAVDQQ